MLSMQAIARIFKRHRTLTILDSASPTYDLRISTAILAEERMARTLVKEESGNQLMARNCASLQRAKSEKAHYRATYFDDPRLVWYAGWKHHAPTCEYCKGYRQGLVDAKEKVKK